MATIAIMVAAIFDFLDGFAARLLDARSSIGLELDSLADVVSFGVAPSAIFYYILSVTQKYISVEIPDIVPFAAFLIAVFSALRLAKFNIDKRQTESFIGLPTPACAIFACGLVYFDIFTATGYFVILALIATLCALLVCELPMFSLKLKKTESSLFIKKYGFQTVLTVCSLILLIIIQLKALSLIVGLYVLLSVVKNQLTIDN
jgi:CDP-diacylglycerol--serine O-phosphatidyltransferase